MTTTAENDAKVQQAIALLIEAGAVYKVWVRADLEGWITDRDLPVPEDRLDDVVDAAMMSRDWRDLADCTEDDWEKVSAAVDKAGRLVYVSEDVDDNPDYFEDAAHPSVIGVLE